MTTPKPRGLAAASPETRARVAAMGGRSVPAEKRGFALNKDVARDAGQKGGKISKRPPLTKG